MKTGISAGAKRLLLECYDAGLRIGRKPMTRKEIERERAKKALGARLIAIHIVNSSAKGGLS